jgi:hypothetical protein
MEWTKAGMAAFAATMISVGLFTVLNPAMQFLGPNQMLGAGVLSIFLGILITVAGWGVLKLGGASRGQGSPTWMLTLAVVAVVGLLAFVTLAMFGFIKTPGTVGGSGGAGNVVITSANAPSLYVNPVDLAQPGSAVSGTSSYVYDASGAFLKDNLAASTAYTVPSSGKLRVFTNKTATYFASEDFAEGDGTNNPINLKVTMPLLTTATVSAYNPSSFTTNAAATNATFGANDQKTFRLDVSGAANKFATNPKINKVVFVLDFTVPGDWLYASTDQTYVEYNGQKCAGTSIPKDATGAEIAWICDAPNGITGSTPATYYLTLKAGSGNPGSQLPKIDMYPVDMYRNTISGLTEMGPQDNTGSLLHAATNTTLYIE